MVNENKPMTKPTNLITLAVTMAGLLLSTMPLAADVRDGWPVEKANEWYAAQPWLIGCNFLPSTAVNS